MRVTRKLRDGYYWRIYYWIHYHFGRDIKELQLGNALVLNRNISTSDINVLLSKYISALATKIHASVIGQPVTLIIPENRSDDPLAQIEVGWKAMFRIHTKRSWDFYVRGLIENNLKFKNI